MRSRADDQQARLGALVQNVLPNPGNFKDALLFVDAAEHDDIEFLFLLAAVDHGGAVDAAADLDRVRRGEPQLDLEFSVVVLHDFRKTHDGRGPTVHPASGDALGMKKHAVEQTVAFGLGMEHVLDLGDPFGS